MAEYRTIKQLRREALGHDALLFSAAFSVGALVYFVGRAIREASPTAAPTTSGRSASPTT